MEVKPYVYFKPGEKVKALSIIKEADDTTSAITQLKREFGCDFADAKICYQNLSKKV